MAFTHKLIMAIVYLSGVVAIRDAAYDESYLDTAVTELADATKQKTGGDERVNLTEIISRAFDSDELESGDYIDFPEALCSTQLAAGAGNLQISKASVGTDNVAGIEEAFWHLNHCGGGVSHSVMYGIYDRSNGGGKVFGQRVCVVMWMRGDWGTCTRNALKAYISANPPSAANWNVEYAKDDVVQNGGKTMKALILRAQTQ